jgi:hypothetical protein
MAKYLQLPNGDSLKVPSDMSYEEAMAAAQKKFPELFSENPKQDTTGFKAAASASATRLGGSLNCSRASWGSKTRPKLRKNTKPLKLEQQHASPPPKKVGPKTLV